ncbi:gas vesicle protein [Nesterenkonia sphaerica]|uniref:gas vesicle protein n=1 Tax=Nesterenkonia sphaerica TaxID=1804988 RepID=UPI001AA0679D|nr:gas vesicle protein [Nesterenkonia sphaerica]
MSENHLPPAHGSAVEQPSALQPTRDPGATLPDLLEVLLNKGVHLNLDLIISVADVPLIGVNLRATIAGIETMIEYGMMRQWDDQTRAWVQRSLSRHLPMADGEEVVAAMAASHLRDDFQRIWRPGRAYLTTHRLIVHRRDPAETLWQTRLDSIASAESYTEPSVGGEDRMRLKIVLHDGSVARLSALDADRLLTLIRQQRQVPGGAQAESAAAEDQGPRMRGTMWYLETFAQGATWRGGKATLTREGMLTWKSPLDNRASLRIEPAQLKAVHLEKHSNPTSQAQVLRVETTSGEVRLAGPDLHKWHQLLHDDTESGQEVDHGAGSQ